MLRRFVSYQRRLLSSAASSGMSASELALAEKLSAVLKPSSISVKDISGGCGSMFSIDVASPVFRGLSLVAQHRLVQETLATEIKSMHGLQIKTSPSSAA